MKLFIDTGSTDEVEEIAHWGVLAGATTNPSLLAKENGDPGATIKRICDLVRGPVSAEVVASDADEMVRQGKALYALDPEFIVVKVPFSQAGLTATKALTDVGIPVNMTLVFSPSQALLSAAAGATYISCFMGRLDDISVNSEEVLAEIVECIQMGDSTAQVLAASIRDPGHVVTAAKLGCEVATVPTKVLRQLLNHPLTTTGIEQFEQDWETKPEFGEWLKGITNQTTGV